MDREKEVRGKKVTEETTTTTKDSNIKMREGRMDKNTTNIMENKLNNRKKKRGKKEKTREKKYGNDNGTQQRNEQLKDQNCIIDLQRTVLQQYNEQQQKEQLKDRNIKFSGKQ